MRVWNIESTVHDTYGSARTATNERHLCLAESFEEAVELFRAKRPDATIHGCVVQQDIGDPTWVHGLIVSPKIDKYVTDASTLGD